MISTNIRSICIISVLLFKTCEYLLHPCYQRSIIQNLLISAPSVLSVFYYSLLANIYSIRVISVPLFTTANIRSICVISVLLFKTCEYLLHLCHQCSIIQNLRISAPSVSSAFYYSKLANICSICVTSVLFFTTANICSICVICVLLCI
jgi:hypothetical protein